MKILFLKNNQKLYERNFQLVNFYFLLVVFVKSN